MQRQTIPITDRATWLAMREQDVTASAAGALLGVHEYLTGFGLWALKTGRLSEDPEETPPMLRGRLLEPVALQLLNEKHPELNAYDATDYYRDADIRLGCTPDAFGEADGDTGIIQIKTVHEGVFKNTWINEHGDIEPPLWIAIQAIVEAHLTGRKWAKVAALVIGYGLDLHVVDVPVHKGVIAKVERVVVEFWDKIASGDIPEPNYGEDMDTINAMYEGRFDEVLDLRTDNRVADLVDRRADLKQKVRDCYDELNSIEAELKHKLGSYTRAVAPGGQQIVWATKHRAASFVSPHSYREFRIRD